MIVTEDMKRCAATNHSAFVNGACQACGMTWDTWYWLATSPPDDFDPVKAWLPEKPVTFGLNRDLPPGDPFAGELPSWGDKAHGWLVDALDAIDRHDHTSGDPFEERLRALAVLECSTPAFNGIARLDDPLESRQFDADSRCSLTSAEWSAQVRAKVKARTEAKRPQVYCQGEDD